MANRTPPSQWGNLFNFAGAGLVHIDLYPLLIVSAQNPTLFEAIASYLLLYGTFAARPSASLVPLNAVYYATDTGAAYQNQAGTWAAIATGGGGGGSGTLGGAHVYATSAQSLPNSTFTALEFNAERYDTDDYHDNSTDNERFTIPTDGLYLLGAQAQLDYGTDTPGFYLQIKKNGSTIIAQSGMAGSDVYPSWPIHTIMPLETADYVELYALQTTGTTANIAAAGDYTPEFWIERLR